MPRQFDSDLSDLQNRLLKMGGLAEKMIHDMIDVLNDGDSSRLAAIYQAEEQMDELEGDVDEETIRLIGIYTPVAGDLRRLMMISRINAELERIADKVVDIAHTTENFLKEHPVKPLVDLTPIAKASETLVHRALDAFVKGSYDEAMDVIRSDDHIDKMNDDIFRVLFTHILDDPRRIGTVLGLIFTAKAFERIADHAVNISENIVYIVRGKDIRHTEKHTPAPKPQP
jgi:phosphate transport system protein